MGRFLLSVLCFGYAFLYVPLFYLIVYSFNGAKHSALWGGFSIKWYQKIWDNHLLLDAAWVSLKVATCAATLSVVVGTLAALSLVRLKKFKGQKLFSVLCAAPLVLPEVILGLSFFLGFIGLGRFMNVWPLQGMTTIIIAHTTMGIAYVILMVRHQLRDMDPQILEAARDLGATPIRTFFAITLPTIKPALKVAWFLSFLLSFDDVVVGSFVSGPETTTLPMAVFSLIRFGMTPEINVLATLFIVGLAILIITIALSKSALEKL